MPIHGVSRRRILVGGAAVIAGGALDAAVIEPNWLDITRHTVAVPKLPRALDGFTIAQVTDAHLRSIGAVEEAIAGALQAHSVQLLVLTGDIIESASDLAILREFCGGLRKQGMTVVATLGNWEHWGQVALPELAAAYADVGATLLVNRATVLPDGVYIAATDDSTGGAPDLAALDGNQGDVRLLLTHSPELLDRAEPGARGFGLALAGHTHGGQVRLGSFAVPVLPGGSGRFVAGWYDLPGCRAYVSRGTGTSIAPVRFTCRPELPLFTLRQG